MLDYTNSDLSNLMLDMMCAEDAMFILVSENGNIISQTSAAEKLLGELPLRPVSEALSQGAAISLKTVLSTKEPVSTIESIDDNLYRLEIRPFNNGALLYFKPCSQLFQGLPAHTQHIIKNSISRNLTAVNILKRKGAENKLLDDIQKNSLRIERELLHLQILENNKNIEILMSPKQNDLVSVCYNVISECRKATFEKGLDIMFNISSPDMLIASFDKNLFEIAIFNLLINSILEPSVSNIYLNIYSENDMAYIEVYDNSNAISKEYINSISTDYLLSMDIDTFMTNGYDEISCGFGLSVVKKITNLHHGVFKISKVSDNQDIMQIAIPLNDLSYSPSLYQSVDMFGLNIADTELSIL